MFIPDHFILFHRYTRNENNREMESWKNEEYKTLHTVDGNGGARYQHTNDTTKQSAQ